ncbi:MAG: DUF134 domain-containing protein [Gammaproteobacteria bacterium]|nr:DUF134 domain-containing protein [Gammaproteobacteria bacterium]
MPPFVKRTRFCRRFDGADYFKPKGVPLADLEVNELVLDELEAIHLCDFDELEQKIAAEKMQISTSTLQRLLYSGRKKIADALYSSKALRILRGDDIAEYSLPRGCGRGNGMGRGQCRR